MEESWVRTDKRTALQKLACSILKRGPIPKHVAFIMDGNRRYANRRNLDRAQGHLLGFDKLTETLEWCLDLGIREVTVYAFSIENFKRSQDEVDCLMELAKRKFTLLLAEKYVHICYLVTCIYFEKHPSKCRLIAGRSLRNMVFA